MQVLCPVIVGRGNELARLEAALMAAARGLGGAVLLTGEAGAGKTRLARELCARTEARGWPVLFGRAVEGTAPAPYRPLAESLATVVRRDANLLAGTDLAPFRAVLARLVPEWRTDAPLAAEPSAFLVGEALLRLLRTLGVRGACLMVLEDLHWADSDSLAVAEYLADNLGGEPVLVLATLRSEEGDEAHALAERLEARRSAGVVSLGRLDADSTRSMTLACLGVTTLPEELDRLVQRRSEGVPFLVEELLAALVASGALQNGDAGWVLAGSVEGLVPESFAAATRRRLASLGGAPSRVLHAAAVLGSQFDWRLLPSMTGLPQHEVLAGLRRGVEAQLLQPEMGSADPGKLAFRFRHALTAEALRDDLLAPERAALARSALGALEEINHGLPSEECELAATLAQAAGEGERAARYLAEAARRALAIGALGTAEATLARASALATESATATALRERLLEVLVLAGRSEEALGLGDVLLEGLAHERDERRELSVHLHLARAATQAGQAVLTEKHLRAGQRLVTQIDAPDALARLQIEMGQVALLEADVEAAASAARQALQASDRSELQCEAWMLLGRALRTINLSDAAEAFEHARAAASEPRLGLWRMLATHELGTIDLLTTNRQDRLVEAHALAASAGALGTLAAIDLHLAVAADTSNAPAEAIERARSCAEIARRLGLAPLVAIGLGLQADVRAMGRARHEVAELAEAVLALPDATADARASAWGALARSSLCAENPERAYAELEAAVACVRRQGHTTAPGPYYGYHALLAALRDRNGPSAIAEARVIGADMAGWNRGLLSCAQAVLAGRNGHKEEAVELAMRAEEALAPYPGYGHLGLRLMAQAAVEDAWGDPGRWLVPALRFAEDRGLSAVGSACRGLLWRAGIPVQRRHRRASQLPAGLDGRGITEREHEVLRLVGEGHSNAEIAARLYISVRTVEKHVEALLRKTDLTRRTQLAALCARTTPSLAQPDGPKGPPGHVGLG